MTMDITDTLAPTSDQLDAVDLLTGPRVFTIEKASRGNAEQPVNIHLAEFPRVWRPGKSMRRVLVAAWGPDASTYAGRRVKLFCDNEVRFGGQAVGGTRIAALSHIEKPLAVPLLVTRGKSQVFTVQPLKESPMSSPAVSAETLAKLTETLQRKGVAEDDWLRGVNHYTGGAATALEVITEDQAHVVLRQLEKRPDVESAAAAADDEEQCAVCGAVEGREEHDTELHEAAGA